MRHQPQQELVLTEPCVASLESIGDAHAGWQ